MRYSKCDFLRNWSFFFQNYCRLNSGYIYGKLQRSKPSLAFLTPGIVKNIVRQQYLKLTTMQLNQLLLSVVLSHAENIITLMKIKGEQKLVELQLKTGLRGQFNVSWQMFLNKQSEASQSVYTTSCM